MAVELLLLFGRIGRGARGPEAVVAVEALPAPARAFHSITGLPLRPRQGAGRDRVSWRQRERAHLGISRLLSSRRGSRSAHPMSKQATTRSPFLTLFTFGPTSCTMPMNCPHPQHVAQQSTFMFVSFYTFKRSPAGCRQGAPPHGPGCLRASCRAPCSCTGAGRIRRLRCLSPAQTHECMTKTLARQCQPSSAASTIIL